MEIQCPACRKFVNKTDHYCQYCGVSLTTPDQESEMPNLQGVQSSVASKFLEVTEKVPQQSYPTAKAYPQARAPTNYRASPSPNNLPIMLARIVGIFGALFAGGLIISTIQFNHIPLLNPPYSGSVDSGYAINPFEQESFPKSACGDPFIPAGRTYYRVFINHQGNNLTMVKQGFCQDAFPRRNSIQVAAFNDLTRAQNFAAFMQSRFGNAWVEEN